jgi:hypothetical protein
VKELFVLTRYQPQIEQRDRLYYDAYQYSLSFQQAELYCIRGLPDSAQLDCYISNRLQYEKYSIYNSNAGTKFTKDVRANLHQTLDFLKNCGIPFKFVVSGQYGSVYTNDLALVDLICKLTYIKIGNLRTAQVSKPRDTVVIRSPEFQYRTYFRERQLSDDRRQVLSDWITAQQGAVKPSPATRQWLTGSNQRWKRDYMQRYYYIEHDSLQYETMLNLIVPGHVRKTVPVISSDK